ncbi:MAG: hypothetical protein ACLFRE_09720, partial [Desulfovermiculus sp.]
KRALKGDKGAYFRSCCTLNKNKQVLLAIEKLEVNHGTKIGSSILLDLEFQATMREIAAEETLAFFAIFF